MTMYRQGDVLLIEVKDLPSGATTVPIDDDGIVLALGEATGHKHLVVSERHGRGPLRRF